MKTAINLIGIGLVLFGFVLASECVDNIPFYVVVIGFIASVGYLLLREHYYFEEDEED